MFARTADIHIICWKPSDGLITTIRMSTSAQWRHKSGKDINFVFVVSVLCAFSVSVHATNRVKYKVQPCHMQITCECAHDINKSDLLQIAVLRALLKRFTATKYCYTFETGIQRLWDFVLREKSGVRCQGEIVHTVCLPSAGVKISNVFFLVSDIYIYIIFATRLIRTSQAI